MALTVSLFIHVPLFLLLYGKTLPLLLAPLRPSLPISHANSTVLCLMGVQGAQGQTAPSSIHPVLLGELEVFLQPWMQRGCPECAPPHSQPSSVPVHPLCAPVLLCSSVDQWR